MKNKYQILKDAPNFSIEALSAPCEIGVELTKLTERATKDADIIELKCTIFWTSKEEDQQHEGQEFDFPIFFGQNSGVNVGIMLNMFRKAGFDVNHWNEDGLSLDVALPGAIKFLVLKGVPVLGTIKQQTNKQNETRKFFNIVKILRIDPATGEKYADALPDQIPNELVVQAYNATLPGESVASVI